MMFSTLPQPYVTRFDVDKPSHEIRNENKGDLSIEKSISKLTLLAAISAIFTAVILVQEETI